MKKLILLSAFLGVIAFVMAQEKKTFNDTAYLQPVEVQAVKAMENSPFAKTNLGKQDIEKQNLGQDIPFVLNQTPSVVVNADAGNGIGYTGIRIRGTDASRINVTINGIPYNDAESQGTFFVDLPDIASSVNSLQVQRGVGTSSNGAGAFGATINLFTNEIRPEHYIALNNSYGSFNTWKNNLQFGTGLLGRHFILEGRLSRISSEGYIERASTALRSAFGSLAWVNEKNSIRLNVFSGKEKTYQAWNGVPFDSLAGNRRFNSAGTEKPGEPYENETDNYLQTHYQLFFNHRFNSFWKGSIAIFYTRGKGYYEQYKADAPLADYGLPDYMSGGTTIKQTDMVRRLWLDNDFYGTVFSLHHQKKKTQFIIGGGYNGYDGNHFGKLVWAKEQAAVPMNHQWYNLTAYKNDRSLYGKWIQHWGKGWQSFADLQYRYVHYRINGFRNNPGIREINRYGFLNPKLGVTYLSRGWKVYLSYALAGKEPNRDDFEAGAAQQPSAERLHDFEWGLAKTGKIFNAGVNFYYMRYRNQLILTGRINDVGAYTRTNIPNSYRAGMEWEGSLAIRPWVHISANASLSINKLKNFTEYIDDYDNGGQKSIYFRSTDISFSPSVIGGAQVSFIPLKNASIDLLSKYVGRQFLDNTGNRSRSLDPFFVEDVRISYRIQKKMLKEANLVVQLNNIFNTKYEPNGYSFSYIYGGKTNTENFYFPMAGFNVMAGLSLKF